MSMRILHMRCNPTLLAGIVLAGLGGAAAQAATPSRNTLGPIGEGRRVWLKLNCYGCHGNNASGGMGPNVQHAESGDVTSAMLHGDAMEGGMRSFKGYANKTDAKNVAAYLKSIGGPNEPTWLDWWNTNP